jgi:3-deoxy-D-manno-octulosonic-acid transferase
VVSAAELIKALESKGLEVCLSTATLTGHQIAQERLPQIPRFSPPLDWPPAVNRLIDAVGPGLFVLVDSDVWPNLLAGFHRRGIPAILCNGRVSPRSYKGYMMVRGFWGRVLRLFDYLGCQSDLDRERLMALGSPPERTMTTGNLKYDRTAPRTGSKVREAILMETGLPGGLWIVAGSTHAGEEEILLNVLNKLLPRFPELHLLIAPRDKTRFEAVWRIVQKTGLPAERRSGVTPWDDPAVFLLDSLGELDRFYELADVVFVGKSLPVPGEGGGHNLLEPAARSKPVLFGPRMHNFPEIARLMTASGGGRQVDDAEELETALAELLADPNLRTAMGKLAKAEVEAHRGALVRTVELIERALVERKPAP